MVTSIDDLKEDFTEHEIRFMYELVRRAYQETKNDMFVWQLYKISRLLNKPIPQEFIDYLDLSLLRMSEYPANEWKNKSSVIMGLSSAKSGRSGGYEEYRNHLRNIIMVCETYIEIQRIKNTTKHTTGIKKSAIQSTADKYSVSFSTVNKLYTQMIDKVLAKKIDENNHVESPKRSILHDQCIV